MAVDALARALAAGKTPVTAYDEAVKAGYTGTEEQFAQDMGNSATNAANAAASASAAAASAESISASAAQIATNTSDISDLKESLTSYSYTELLQDGFYKTNTEYIQPFTENATYKSCMIFVKPDDKITITGAGSSSARLWATANADRKILRVSDANAEETEFTITIADGECLFVFNAYAVNTRVPSITIEFNKNRNTQDEIADEYLTKNNAEIINSVLWAQPYFDLNAYRRNDQSVLGDLTADNTYKSTVIPVRAGEIYKIRGRGGPSARLWSTQDYNGNILRRSDANLNALDGAITVTIQFPEKTLCINTYQNSASNVCFVGGINQIQNIQKDIYSLEANDVTPEMFGAVGDGITDDTIAVEKALQNESVFLPNKYAVSRIIETNAKRIRGSGTVYAVNGFIDCKKSVKIEDISIVNTDGTAIITEKDCAIHSITIDGGRNGIDCGYEYSSIVDINNITVKNLSGESSYGIQCVQSDFVTIQNCKIEEIHTTSGINADGIKFYKQNNVGNTPVLISKCIIHNCDGRHIKDQSNNSIIEKCYLYNDADYPIYTSDDGESRGYITEFRSIDLQYRGFHRISDCDIKSSKTAIYVQNVNGNNNNNVIIDHNKVLSYNYYTIVVGKEEENNFDLIIITKNEISSNYNSVFELSGISVGKIVISENRFLLVSGYPIRILQWDDETRLECKGNTWNNNGQIMSPSYKILNFYSDKLCATNSADITFLDISSLNNIRFTGKISDISDIDSQYLIEKKEDCIYVSSDFVYRVYNKNGVLLS